MSDREALQLYRRLDGAQAEVKGLKRKVKRLEAMLEGARTRIRPLTEHEKEWPPHAVRELWLDRDRLTVDNARYRQQLFAKGVKIECNTCGKPFFFEGIDVDQEECCKCVGG
jgi:hypothetical protein